MVVDLNSYKELYFKISSEYLQQLKNNLSNLQNGIGDQTNLEFEIYRLVHMLKGQSYFMGFTNFGDLYNVFTKIFLNVKEKKTPLSVDLYNISNSTIETLIKANYDISKNILVDLSVHITNLQNFYNKHNENSSN